MNKQELTDDEIKCQETLRDDKGRFLSGGKPGPGRPQGSLSLLTLIKQHLAQVPDKSLNGKTRAQLVAENYVLLAMQGDKEVIRDLVNRVDGKPKERIENTTSQIIRVVYSDNEKINEFDELHNEMDNNYPSLERRDRPTESKLAPGNPWLREPPK